MNRLRAAAAVAFLLRAAVAAGQDAATVGETLRRLEDRMADVQSVRASFTQTRQSPLFDKPLVLRGDLGFERPARFAWRVREPLPYRLVLDGGGFRQWDAETDRVQEGRVAGNPVMATVVDKLTGFFAGRYAGLTNDFDVTVGAAAPLELSCRARPGTPAAAMGQALRIRFRDDERYVAMLEITDAQGVTRIDLDGVELNAALPAGFWKVPPLD